MDLIVKIRDQFDDPRFGKIEVYQDVLSKVKYMMKTKLYQTDGQLALIQESLNLRKTITKPTMLQLSYIQLIEREKKVLIFY